MNAANDLGATPLWIASENGSAPLVDALLQAGANPNLALLLGETPLMVASRSGKADVVEQLLAKGADVNARGRARPDRADVGRRRSGTRTSSRCCVAHGADVHSRSDVWSQMMAVPPHGVPLYNKVIPHGGDTALLFAARSGDLASAKLLVAAGANVNDADAWGVSATVMAAHSGFAELVEFLLERGADPNAAGAGFTALHAAIMRRAPADGERAARARRRSERAAQDLDADAALVEGLQLRARARRRHAVLAGGPLQRARRHAAAARSTAPMRVSCITATTTPKSPSSRARRSPPR